MPIYEYICENEKCSQNIFEKLVNLKDKDKVVNCPICNSEAKKKISSFGFSLKGKGFHVNDYPTADRYIGQDAEKKWDKIYERQSTKNKFKKDENSKHLAKVPDGTYLTTNKELYKVNHKSETEI
jgi:putative FmdB family regulatory protein